MTMKAKLLILSFLLTGALTASLEDDSALSFRCPQPLVNCLFNDVARGEFTE